MTPLQKVAMGLVLVAVDAYFGQFDAVPDVLGWTLILLGLVDLRTRLPQFMTLALLASIAAAVSVVLVWPDLLASAPESAEWALSLPQIAFSVVLCGSVATLCESADPPLARRFSALRWTFVGLAVAPVVLYGGRVEVLVIPVAVATVVAVVVLVYLLFTVSTQPFVTKLHA